MIFLPAFLSKHKTQVLVAILLVMIATRYIQTYGNANRILRPAESSFAYRILGRDLIDYTVRPVYLIRSGKTPPVFGYGSPLVAMGAVSISETTGICRVNRQDDCMTSLYHGMLLASLVTYAAFILFCFRDNGKRTIAFLIFSVFLLGVPMNKAIEAGNLDLLLSPVFGLCFVWARNHLKQGHMTVAFQILFGLILGMLANMKLFVLPWVLWLILVTASSGIYTLIFGIAGFIASALWPRLWGVPASLFDVVRAALRDTHNFAPQLYTQINYGNNAVVGYVSGILQAFDTHRVSLAFHILATNALSLMVLAVLFILPFIIEHARWKYAGKQLSTSVNKMNIQQPVFLLFIGLSYVFMIAVPAWSFDYRIVYGIPVLFLLFNEITDAKTERLLLLSVICLLVKCLWIPKDRIMNIFLYLHLFYAVRAYLSHFMRVARGIPAGTSG